MEERDKQILRNARKLRVKVVGEEINDDEEGLDLNLRLEGEEEEEESQALTTIKVISKDKINEEEFKQLFDVNVYLTDILENEFLCYCFESEDEIELTPALKEKLLKFAINNKARIIINDEVIYDYVEKKDIRQAIANSVKLKKPKTYEIIVWTDKLPVEYKYKDIIVRVDENGVISYEGNLERITTAGNDFFILDSDAPYYVVEEDDKFYLLLGQDFKNKDEFSAFVKQMIDKKWEGAKLLRRKEIHLKNTKIILCFYIYNNRRFISIISQKSSVYRSVV
jgi:hypothetical protein